MPTITLTTSTDFALRVKAAMVNERPDLANATNTVMNAAIQKKIRNLTADWVHNYERMAAATSAASGVAAPTDADIT
jgi:hypothetical protein